MVVVVVDVIDATYDTAYDAVISFIILCFDDIDDGSFVVVDINYHWIWIIIKE